MTQILTNSIHLFLLKYREEGTMIIGDEPPVWPLRTSPHLPSYGAVDKLPNTQLMRFGQIRSIRRLRHRFSTASGVKLTAAAAGAATNRSQSDGVNMLPEM